MKILAPISVGELIDKITILDCKLEFIQDPEKRANCAHEQQQLRDIWHSHFQSQDPVFIELEHQLLKINRELWHIEEAKRQCEREQHWGEEFVELARSVYIKNDLRARIKREINDRAGSDIREEKSYATYTA